MKAKTLARSRSALRPRFWQNPSYAQQSSPPAAGARPGIRSRRAAAGFHDSALRPTASVAALQGAVRVTHRFGRLSRGQLREPRVRFFSLDSSAQIGLEYRFRAHCGEPRGGDLPHQRSTIELFVEHDIMQQSAARPIALSAFAAADGTKQLPRQYSPALGAIVSRKVRQIRRAVTSSRSG